MLKPLVSDNKARGSLQAFGILSFDNPDHLQSIVTKKSRSIFGVGHTLDADFFEVFTRCIDIRLAVYTTSGQLYGIFGPPNGTLHHIWQYRDAGFRYLKNHGSPMIEAWTRHTARIVEAPVLK